MTLEELEALARRDISLRQDGTLVYEISLERKVGGATMRRLLAMVEDNIRGDEIYWPGVNWQWVTEERT